MGMSMMPVSVCMISQLCWLYIAIHIPTDKPLCGLRKHAQVLLCHQFKNDLTRNLLCVHISTTPETLVVGLQAQCSIRDCKVGPGFKLAERSEYRDEVLANVKQ